MREVGLKLPSLPIKALRRTRVLEYFEGCLLVEYRTNGGDIFLFSWVDSDTNYNRWIVFRISERDLARYLQSKVSLRELIFGCRDGFVYIADTDGEGNRSSVALANLDLLPSDYIPAEDSLFDAELMPPSARPSYGILIDGAWSLRDLADFPRVYRNSYNMLWKFGLSRGSEDDDVGVSEDNVSEVSDDNEYAEYLLDYDASYELEPPSSREFQHDIHRERGWATVNLYSKLERDIPEGEKPQLLAMSYSSPGVINMRLNIGVSLMVRDAVTQLQEHDRELSYLDDLIYKAVHRGEALASLDLDVQMQRFAHLLGNLRYEELKSATRETRYLADLLRAHLRMLRRLSKYLEQGKVQSL